MYHNGTNMGSQPGSQTNITVNRLNYGTSPTTTDPYVGNIDLKSPLVWNRLKTVFREMAITGVEIKWQPGSISVFNSGGDDAV